MPAEIMRTRAESYLLGEKEPPTPALRALVGRATEAREKWQEAQSALAQRITEVTELRQRTASLQGAVDVCIQLIEDLSENLTPQLMDDEDMPQVLLTPAEIEREAAASC